MKLRQLVASQCRAQQQSHWHAGNRGHPQLTLPGRFQPKTALAFIVVASSRACEWATRSFVATPTCCCGSQRLLVKKLHPMDDRADVHLFSSSHNFGHTCGILVACCILTSTGTRERRVSYKAAADAAPPDPPASIQEAGEVPKLFNPKRQIGVTDPLGFFDPLGICPKDQTVFNEYRACEIKHGRVAMLATVGAITQHFVRFPGFTYTNFGKALPSGVGAVTETPGSFGFCILLAVAGILELLLWKDGVDPGKGEWTKEPGNFGDPLGLGQYNDDMRNRELNNGRMAMFAALGIIVAEFATGRDGVAQLGF